MNKFAEFYTEVPKFCNREYNIVEFGAVEGGQISNTDAINGAINRAAQTGGRVIIPNGMWKTGPIFLKSGVELHLEDNAILFFSKSKDEYPLIVTDYEGIKRIRTVSQINAENECDIAITGNGVIDGCGHLWRPVKQFKLTDRQWNRILETSKYVIDSKEGGVWCPTKTIYDARFAGEVFPDDYPTEKEALQAAEPYYDFYRPVMVSLKHCNNVLLSGVTFKNSAAWMIHPYFCENVTIDSVRIENPYSAQNGDGIDVDSCKNVHIHHSSFETGDDGICLKAGKDRAARALLKPCENVYIHDCKVGNSHGGFVIGSEMSRGVRNVLIKDCSFIDADVGIRFKSAMGRGGVVEDIFIENIKMLSIRSEAVVITMDYVHNLMDYNDPVVESEDPEDIPEFRNIYMKNCTCLYADMAVKIHGLTGHPQTVHDIVFEKFQACAKKNADLLDCQNIEFVDCDYSTCAII